MWWWLFFPVCILLFYVCVWYMDALSLRRQDWTNRQTNRYIRIWTMENEMEMKLSSCWYTKKCAFRPSAITRNAKWIYSWTLYEEVRLAIDAYRAQYVDRRGNDRYVEILLARMKGESNGKRK